VSATKVCMKFQQHLWGGGEMYFIRFQLNNSTKGGHKILIQFYEPQCMTLLIKQRGV
jgi:hypothetical protein